MISKLVMRPRVWNQLFNGAQKGSQRAINRLFEIAEPSIKAMAETSSRNATEYSEFYARGCEALMEAINRQKEPVKKAQNYLLTCIRGQMLTLRESMKKYYSRHIPLEQAGMVSDSVSPDKVGTIIDRVIDKKATDPNTAIYLKEVLRKICSLPKNKREVELSRIFGESSRDVAKRLGIKEFNVDKIYERVKKELLAWKKKN